MNIGGKCYEEEVERDLVRHPIEMCDVEKRRRCDSLYANLNRKQKKEILRLREEKLHLQNKLILISDLLYCNQLSDELKYKILEVVNDEC